MRTIVTASPRKAAEFIMQGEVVAFPTETVYGLGANVFDEKALRKIFAAKRRPGDNPLITHIARIEEFELLARRIPLMAEKFIERFFPGPLTLVLPKLPSVPLIATAGLHTIGIRMPHHPIAHALLEACGVPLAAPSANLSGKPSPTTWRSVYADLDGRIRCILKGGQTKVGLESTVVDCTGKFPVVLRKGAVSLEQLRSLVPATRLPVRDDSIALKSPGMKYRHYSPHARVVLITTPKELSSPKGTAYIGMEHAEKKTQFKAYKICCTVEEYAHALFLFFRDCDAAGVSTIYCQEVDERGLGSALMDRLKRAAHH